MLANIFLGIYYNLSIWYKLTDKTYFGALFSLVGAVITIVMNLILIPKIGFMGSAITTLACYVVMTITSYFLSKEALFNTIRFETIIFVFNVNVNFIHPYLLHLI